MLHEEYTPDVQLLQLKDAGDMLSVLPLDGLCLDALLLAADCG